MIVCEAGDRWQIVLQTDHAELSGALARSWRERSERSGSLAVAAERHDDGWAVWEQAPSVDPRSGRPVNFLDVGIRSHLAFYRAGIAAIGEQDPYAGLLVSMHGAGIYRGRYGLQPELAMTLAGDARDQVEAFVAEQERAFETQQTELGVSPEERWRDYRLLQLFDRISLLFCTGDALAPPAAELLGYRFEPDGPGAVRIDPFPFADGEQRFTLVRRTLPKRAWPDAEAFRREFFATAPERVSLTISAN